MRVFFEHRGIGVLGFLRQLQLGLQQLLVGFLGLLRLVHERHGQRLLHRLLDGDEQRQLLRWQQRFDRG
jgi:hypothetical protein